DYYCVIWHNNDNWVF
nr:immunoglobulin light chain junction region [Macaca mulatta]MOX70630.1 immunoglobulin light chain junction region [Macaca mulatta]MOX73002.1 immunoglobulin light chain junction region [Macaca mulatta]MOX75962.1 immunoglobulin light chain junction region [Macaca mulatta]MOX76203.1 immunoglobulin light chain junction region [Macaca mulatta]